MSDGGTTQETQSECSRLGISRRTFLTTTLAAGVTTTAGCGSSSSQTTSIRIEPVVESSPRGVGLYPDGQVGDTSAMAELLSDVDTDALAPTDDGGFLLHRGVMIREDDETVRDIDSATGGYWVQIPELTFAKPLQVEYQYVPTSQRPCEAQSEHPAPVAPLVDDTANDGDNLFGETTERTDLPTAETFAERTYRTDTRWADSEDGRTESVPAHTLFYHHIYTRIRELENLKYARLGLLDRERLERELDSSLRESWTAIRQMNTAVVSFLSPTLAAIFNLTDNDPTIGDAGATASVGTNFLSYLEEFDYLDTVRNSIASNLLSIVGAVNLARKTRKEGEVITREALSMVDSAVQGSTFKGLSGSGSDVPASVPKLAGRLAAPAEDDDTRQTVSQLVTFRDMSIEEAVTAFTGSRSKKRTDSGTARDKKQQYVTHLEEQQRAYYKLLRSLKPLGSGSESCGTISEYGLVPRNTLYSPPDSELPTPEYTDNPRLTSGEQSLNSLPDRRTLFDDILEGDLTVSQFRSDAKEEAIADGLSNLKELWDPSCNYTLRYDDDPEEIAGQALKTVYVASLIEHTLSATEMQAGLHGAVVEGDANPVTDELWQFFGCQKETDSGQEQQTTAEPTPVIKGPFNGWQSYQADSRNTGRIEGQPGPTQGLTQKWLFDEPAEQVAPLVVHGNTVYAGRDGQLIAIDAELGTEQWRYTPDAGVTATPTVRGDSIYVPIDGGVATLSAADGSERWRVADYDGPGVGGVVGNDHIYQTIGGSGLEFGQVVALSVADDPNERETWSFQGKPGQLSEIDAVPAYADGTVFAGVKQNSVPYPLSIVALNADSGETRWRTSLGDESGLSAVTATETHVIAVSNKQVAVLARDSGEILWTDEMVGIGFQTPVVDDDTVYVNWTETQQVRAYALETGEERWRYDGFGDGAQMGDLAVVDGTVYTGGNGRITALSAADGSPQLTGETILQSGQTQSFVAPVVVGGALFVNTDTAVVALSE